MMKQLPAAQLLGKCKVKETEGVNFYHNVKVWEDYTPPLPQPLLTVVPARGGGVPPNEIFLKILK